MTSFTHTLFYCFYNSTFIRFNVKIIFFTGIIQNYKTKQAAERELMIATDREVKRAKARQYQSTLQTLLTQHSNLLTETCVLSPSTKPNTNTTPIKELLLNTIGKYFKSEERACNRVYGKASVD